MKTTKLLDSIKNESSSKNLNRRGFIKTIGGITAGAALSPKLHLADNPIFSGSLKNPNIILIMCDDLGYGNLSSYGHPTIKTPSIDRIGKEGARLASHCTPHAVCTPSRVALLTGRYPKRTGLTGNLGPDSKRGLSLNEILLPQLLKSAGYKTMMIGKWHLGHDPVDYMPTSRGFDSYYGLLYSVDMTSPFVNSKKPISLYRDTKPIETPVVESTLTERYTDEAVKFIKSSKEKPFFLYLAHSFPHLPISTSKRFLGKSDAGLLGDVIETIDWSTGQILKTLEEEGIDKNTIIVFTSDHGPWLNLPDRMFNKYGKLAYGNQDIPEYFKGKEPEVKPYHQGTAGLLRGSKMTTWEGGSRIPCLIRWPSQIPSGQVKDEISNHMDLYATIAKAAGAELPKDRKIDGNNLLSWLKGNESTPDKEMFYFRLNVLQAVRQGKWKLRYGRDEIIDNQNDLLVTRYGKYAHLDDTGPNDELKQELYNLSIDPSEKYNVAEENPEITSRLMSRLKEFANEIKAEIDK